MSQSDFEKRKEMLAELVYYVFDSFIIPLIRSNFHVTESNAHRNRLFYFRHDVWRHLTEPTIAELKCTTYEEMKPVEARKVLSSRTFGYSTIRLLPKATGFRPIANLRRRMLTWHNGKKVLGRSINSLLTPTFKVLDYEKVRTSLNNPRPNAPSETNPRQTQHPAHLGASLFSAAEAHARLRAFAAAQHASRRGRPLFFAKVDVSACFDTVPQAKLLDVVAALLASENYQVEQHAMVKARGGAGVPPRVRFFAKGCAAAGRAQAAAGGAAGGAAAPAAADRVFVGPLARQSVRRQQVLESLASHVRQNLVRLGKKYYVQRRGIPQGSVVSSLLVNVFYGRLEAEVLGWEREPAASSSAAADGKPDYLLMRLIDDFLLVTTSRARAEAFLRVLHRGVPEYGVAVKPEKSLANFAVTIDGRPVPRCDAATFPYCGLAIDVRSLEIRKESGPAVASGAGSTAADALTVEFSSAPGRSFQRRALNAFKIRMHAMFVDSAFNSLEVVAANLFAGFREAALRMLSYVRCLPATKRPSTKLIVGKSHFSFYSREISVFRASPLEARLRERGNGRSNCFVQLETRN